VNRIAYLLCELKARDLDSRLLIASQLLKENIAVVVGQRWGVGQNGFTSPKGCFLFPTANQIQGEGMEQMREVGHMVVASDEEALPLVDSLVNVASNAVEHCHKFLVDSETHRTLLDNQFKEHADKFSVTGSSRIEALELFDTDPIGGPPYILFNSGFALVNSVWGDLRSALEKLLSGASISEEEAVLRINVERAGFECMRAVAKSVMAHHRIVIRPHPAERAQMWRDEFPQAEVVETSSSIPWIKGARAVVHANSTTGLEAAVLGVPCINLDPLPTWGDRFLMKQVNYTVGSAQDAIDALETHFENGHSIVGNSPDASMFPKGGAINTAKAIGELIGSRSPLPGKLQWTPTDRTDTQKSKFTVSGEEIKDSPHIKAVPGCGVEQLDDSIFLLTPTSATTS
jgi:surface carbohydrate biosynthesis protein